MHAIYKIQRLKNGGKANKISHKIKSGSKIQTNAKVAKIKVNTTQSFRVGQHSFKLGL